MTFTFAFGPSGIGCSKKGSVTVVVVAMVAPPPTAQIGTKGTRGGLTHTLCTTPATHTASTGSTLSLNLNRIMVLISSCDCSPRHRLSPHLQPDTTYDSLKNIHRHCSEAGKSEKEGQGVRALSIFGLIKTSLFSTNAQSRFASVVLDSALGPPRLAQHS